MSLQGRTRISGKQKMFLWVIYISMGLTEEFSSQINNPTRVIQGEVSWEKGQLKLLACN
jgi:hypothetical protein